MITCIAWYLREQWSHLRQVSADAADLEDTYDEWEQNAEKAIQKFIAQGMQIRKIVIDVNELVQWCEVKGVSVDGAARSRYAAEKGEQQDKAK